MSKAQEIGWRAFHMFVVTVVYIISTWPIKPSNSPEINGIFQVLITIFSVIALILLIIAIAGWCNINILKLYSKKEKTPDCQPLDREFDEL